MDPQLEEYRRRQRERLAEGTVGKKDQMRGIRWAGLLSVGGVICVVAAVATLTSASSGVSTGLVSPADATGTTAATVRGVCPETTGQVGICVEQCSSHADCAEEGKLCCSNGCGHVCTAPADPTKPKPAARCTLMAILDKGQSDLSELEQQALDGLPAPEKKDLLKSSGILILTYKTRVSDCCKAKELLDAKSMVKSTEFDGKAPICNKEL